MITKLPDEEAIFKVACQIPFPAARADYLNQICGDDRATLHRIQALLRVHEHESRFLMAPPPGVAATQETPAPAESVGTAIGPYKLLEQIGEGGMGLVYMAEQHRPVRRLVALKIIKPGMDSQQVSARFEAEKQALAMMDHPNIAKVLDAGITEAGRPYFVMELVRGIPMNEFCDQKRLNVRERLELMIQVCQAVQHAHQRGIIHRDLKPTNVLITMHDSVAVPKVIDFGIAKALGAQLTEHTLHTGYSQLVGTPLYMSPEQAEMNQLGVDTRSDVYSLGVMLYELLTGSTPFDKETLTKAGFDEMRRIIREQEPPRPSARLSTLQAQALSTVSERRKSDPRRITTTIRGELDWIVMKAIEKDRNRRYESGSALAADVRRYLNAEPVHACPPSTWYRFHKLARRNMAALATAAGLAAAAVVALVSLGSAVRVLEVSNEQIKSEQKQTSEALGREKQANDDLTKSLKREERAAYAQRIALAERELAAHNVGRSEELLDACPPDLRGWEWRFLKRQRYGDTLPLQHPNTVHRVAFSPDGVQIASGCLDGKVRIWDRRTRQVLHELTRSAEASPLIRVLAYSRDHRWLAAGYQDGEIRVWNSVTGELIASLQGHEGIVWQVAFSPDCRTLASAGQDLTVRLWDISAQQDCNADGLIRSWSEQPAPVKGVAFSRNGERLLAACRDGTVKSWDVSSGREVSAFQHSIQYVDNACFSPDARRIAWSCQDGVIKVWDVVQEREQFAVQSNTGFGRAIAFSPDSQRIAIAGFDGTLRLLDGATGQETLTIYAHPSLVSGVAFSADGNQVASASYDYTIRIWDATELPNEPLAPYCVTLNGHTQQVYGVAFSLDGRWLASASMDGTVKVWECNKSIALRYTLRGHKGDVTSVSFSPDGRILASGSWDCTVKLWDLDVPAADSLTERGTIRLPDRVVSVCFSPDGRMLALGQPNGIAIYDPLSLKEVYPFKRTMTPVPALVFSPDSQRLISAGATDASVKIWNIAGERPATQITHYSNPNSTVDISPDGKLIASPGREQDAGGQPTVKIWDAQTQELRRTLKGHDGYVWVVAFSPDGNYFASGSWDSTIKVWNLAAPDSAEPVTLRGHAGFIRSLEFSPDGRRLASSSGYSGHGEVKIWDATLWNPRPSDDQ